MKAIIIIFLSSLLIVGCARQYCHPDRDRVQRQRAIDECNYEAEKATGSMKTGFDRGLNQGKIFSQCMKVNGWGLKESEHAPCVGYIQ